MRLVFGTRPSSLSGSDLSPPRTGAIAELEFCGCDDTQTLKDEIRGINEVMAVTAQRLDSAADRMAGSQVLLTAEMRLLVSYLNDAVHGSPEG